MPSSEWPDANGHTEQLKCSACTAAGPGSLRCAHCGIRLDQDNSGEASPCCDYCATKMHGAPWPGAAAKASPVIPAEEFAASNARWNERVERAVAEVIPVAVLREWAARQSAIWWRFTTDEAKGYRAALDDLKAHVLDEHTRKEPRP